MQQDRDTILTRAFDLIDTKRCKYDASAARYDPSSKVALEFKDQSFRLRRAMSDIEELVGFKYKDYS